MRRLVTPLIVVAITGFAPIRSGSCREIGVVWVGTLASMNKLAPASADRDHHLRRSPNVRGTSRLVAAPHRSSCE
jgi:hypothetical protein